MQGGRHCQFKLVLLGESAVGKSSLVLRFDKNQFHEHQEPTIGAAFVTQTVLVDDVTVKFEIWDTAGQERYTPLAPMYYRGAHAAIVVYDITSSDSFARAQFWIRELNEKSASAKVVALAGNKLDLQQQRAVQLQEAEQLAEEKGLVFFETSARSGVNVNDMFLTIAKRLTQVADLSSAAGAGGGGVALTANDSGDRRRPDCCH